MTHKHKFKVGDVVQAISKNYYTFGAAICEVVELVTPNTRSGVPYMHLKFPDGSVSKTAFKQINFRLLNNNPQTDEELPKAGEYVWISDWTGQSPYLRRLVVQDVQPSDVFVHVTHPDNHCRWRNGGSYQVDQWTSWSRDNYEVISIRELLTGYWLYFEDASYLPLSYNRLEHTVATHIGSGMIHIDLNKPVKVLESPFTGEPKTVLVKRG